VNTNRHSEPDECGQDWHNAIATAGVWVVVVLFATVLFLSALRWIGLL